MRFTLKVAFVLTGLLLASGIHARCGGEKRQHSFIVVNDLRPELDCYGSPQVKSSNNVWLAGEGGMFTRFYTCTVSFLSRASLLMKK